MRLYEQFWILGRLRTQEGLGILAHRMPAKVVKALPGIRLYAPCNVLGEVISLPCNGEVLIVLHYELESLPQRVVNYVVAHEFAHVVLGHYGADFQYADSSLKHNDKPEEVATDRLVASWGYAASDHPMANDSEAMRREAQEEDRRVWEEVEAERQGRGGVSTDGPAGS